MKTKFIRINDIAEINTASATVYDMNNRYIDVHGNMYGLKYNRDSRKIEVIRILRTPANAATYYDQQMVENRRLKQEKQENGEVKPEPVSHEEIQPPAQQEATGIETEVETTEGKITDEAKSTEKRFSPSDFITNTMTTMGVHRDRLNSIITNLNNSDLVSKKNGNESSNLGNIFRNIDIDGIQRIDKIINTHKELVNYPRSITFYSAKLDASGKNILESLDNDAQRMEYIKSFEMFHSIRHLYRTLNKFLNELQEELEKINLDEMRAAGATDKQNIVDAITTIKTTSVDIKNIFKGLLMLESYLKNANHFQ